ncbi:sigma-54-dependent transcriptional regulator [Desulfospira joergensenii]|uniref:sigma-54-dependent transcriptional regulator n=1 Tax=Desulfospira joergensenii TaxID=53329 RepID=UPI0003B38A59|nr:sigma-54 dependent transcriptional regulator [Desulfospira joergensenii]
MIFKIMIIDDDPVTLKRLRQLLERQGYGVSSYSDPVRALKHMEKNAYHLVVTDVKMAGMDGMDLMITVKTRFPGTDVILMTGYASIGHAVEATREGATDYLEKPFTPEAFLKAVKKTLERIGSQQEKGILEDLKSDSADIPVIIGNSPKIKEIENLVQQIAPTDCNVLITGDSGSGKELVAKLIHAASSRSKGPFVAVNCGAFTETLLDNELFGHEKGAFTGAVATHPGLLESADKGTILLDEIGEMPHSMQVKLLRALQEKELIRVGGNNAVSFDVRVISATAKDLKAEVEAGGFRKDMFYRINVVNIELPGLKERPEDIPLLAYHILNRLNQRQGNQIRRISSRAMSLLENYVFPGNVRELENILERAAAISTGQDIRACDLPPDLTDLELHAYQRPRDHMMTLAELEKDYISHLLRNTHHTRTRIAQILGIDRASLWRKIKKFGLD